MGEQPPPQRVKQKRDDDDGRALHRVGIEPVAPEHRVGGVVLALHQAEPDELAHAGLHPVAQQREHDEVDDEVAHEGPAAAGDPHLLGPVGVALEREVVDQRRLDARRRGKVEDERDVVDRVGDRAGQREVARNRAGRHGDDEVEGRDGEHERPGHPVAVDEEPERHGLEDDRHPVDHGDVVVDDRVARGQEQGDEHGCDVQREDDLDDAHHAQAVGRAELDRVEGAARGPGRRVVLGVGLLAGGTLPPSRGADVVAVAALLGDVGETTRVVGKLVGLHGEVDHAHGLLCAGARGSRDGRAVGTAGGEGAVDGPLGAVEGIVGHRGGVGRGLALGFGPGALAHVIPFLRKGRHPVGGAGFAASSSDRSIAHIDGIRRGRNHRVKNAADRAGAAILPRAHTATSTEPARRFCILCARTAPAARAPTS